MPPDDELWTIAGDLSPDHVMTLLRSSTRWVPVARGYEHVSDELKIHLRTTERRRDYGPPDVFGEVQVWADVHTVAYYRDKVKEHGIHRLLARLTEAHAAAVKAQHRVYAAELEARQSARSQERESAIQALRRRFGFKK